MRYGNELCKSPTPKCKKCGDGKIIGQGIVLGKLCRTGLRDDDEHSMSFLMKDIPYLILDST